MQKCQNREHQNNLINPTAKTKGIQNYSSNGQFYGIFLTSTVANVKLLMAKYQYL